MIVNLNSADRTWQTHLSGLLIILQQIPDNTTKFTLTRAVEISDSVTNIHKALESSTAYGLQRACLLLDIVKLQLHKLVAEIDAIASNSPPPLRKLDLQKLQVSIKRIRKHLDLFPIVVGDSIRSSLVTLGRGSPHCVNQVDKGPRNDLTDGKLKVVCNFLVQSIGSDYLLDLFVVQWIQFYTLQVMTAAVLLKIGSFLYPDATYHGKREFRVLSHIIQEAAEGICSITTSYVGLCPQTARDGLEMPQMKTTQALMVIWPLFCVSAAPGLAERQKSWAREALWVLGEQCSIPKALSLVSWPPIKQLYPPLLLKEI